MNSRRLPVAWLRWTATERRDSSCRCISWSVVQKSPERKLFFFCQRCTGSVYSCRVHLVCNTSMAKCFDGKHTYVVAEKQAYTWAPAPKHLVRPLSPPSLLISPTSILPLSSSLPPLLPSLPCIFFQFPLPSTPTKRPPEIQLRILGECYQLVLPVSLGK